MFVLSELLPFAEPTESERVSLIKTQMTQEAKQSLPVRWRLKKWAVCLCFQYGRWPRPQQALHARLATVEDTGNAAGVHTAEAGCTGSEGPMGTVSIFAHVWYISDISLYSVWSDTAARLSFLSLSLSLQQRGVEVFRRLRSCCDSVRSSAERIQVGLCCLYCSSGYRVHHVPSKEGWPLMFIIAPQPQSICNGI